ncbi:MAG: hypothetical protein H8D78_21730 [Chloroflexi bacterium]|nr:hypothetical protein [Chloroflexota bacterium]
MSQDVIVMVERYLSEDPAQWAKLASDIQYRRLHLLLQREILLELRKLNREELRQENTGEG